MFRLDFSSHVVQAVKDVVELLGGPPKVFDVNSLLVVGTMAQIPGDYIEIGTWFGGSALVTALVKKRAEIAGAVTCVDSFVGLDEYDIKPSREQVLDSASRLNVELSIIAKQSNPWPTELEDKVWTVGYVDGDHQMAEVDTKILSRRVTRFLMLDDLNLVENQMLRFLAGDSRWSIRLLYRGCAVLGRMS